MPPKPTKQHPSQTWQWVKLTMNKANSWLCPLIAIAMIRVNYCSAPQNQNRQHFLPRTSMVTSRDTALSCEIEEDDALKVPKQTLIHQLCLPFTIPAFKLFRIKSDSWIVWLFLHLIVLYNGYSIFDMAWYFTSRRINRHAQGISAIG